MGVEVIGNLPSQLNQHHGFQGLIVLQMLEAHLKLVKQELDRQRQEQSMFQLRVQNLLSQTRGDLAMGARPLY